MTTLHEKDYVAAIEARLQRLVPDAKRRWGVMTVDQMLWHVNTALEISLGRLQPAQENSPLPRRLMKFIVLNMPWPKNAPTTKATVAHDTFDFAAERERTMQLIREFAGRELSTDWPDQPMFGRMRGRDWSRLQARHLDHHLRQFGA